jgi:hypothetical protein
MSSTEDLVATLSSRLEPVQCLRPPLLRALGWITFATSLIGVFVLLREPRQDLGSQLTDPAYLIQVAGAWLTGAAATLAAFHVSLPDRPRTWLFLPPPFVALWLSGFAIGCLGHWIGVASGAPIVPDSVRCLETIIMASLPLSLVLWFMLRRAKPLRPSGTAWMGGLAVAAFADTAHLLIHVVEASLLVLVINLVPATIIVLIGGLVGRYRLAGV